MPAEARPKVLLVEDSLSLAAVYREYLRNEEIDLSHVETGRDALRVIRRDNPAVVILDLRLPDMDGLDLLHLVRDEEINSSVVVITAYGSLNLAVSAMKAGAVDFLVKPFNAERLCETLRHVVQRHSLGRLGEPKRRDVPKEGFCEFIGDSVVMQALYRVIQNAAPSKATVFVTGESGTGKELCAQALHQMSPRGKGEFVAINVAAIPKDLMESAIFGHVKGSFTGATRDQDGAAKRADGGTLFLDEICDMNLDLQTKLLRFLQTGSFEPVGSGKSEAVDLRVVCATNKDPWVEVQKGRFREDLYYRLHVIPVQMPPLRERGEDVLTLARHFLVEYAHDEGKRFKRFSPQAEDRILAYDWPGNVRQLQNIVRHAVVLNDDEVLEAEMLPAFDPGAASRYKPQILGSVNIGLQRRPDTSASLPVTASGKSTDEIVPLWKTEKAAIEEAIIRFQGNIPKAAAELGISPSTIYRKKVSWEAQERALAKS